MTLSALQRRLSCLAAEPTITVYFSQPLPTEVDRTPKWHAIIADRVNHIIGTGHGEDIIDAIATAEIDFRQTVAARMTQEHIEQETRL